MPTIRFKAKPFKIGSLTLLRLPKSASEKLPSRGITFVTGTVNNIPFQAVLEPDGKGSHWLKVEEPLLKTAHIGVDIVEMAIEPSANWPEPTVPDDLKNALLSSPHANSLWMEITPLARWDWIRWIGATKSPQTRRKRIEVACDKLNKGDKRPCCFNRNQCTVPAVSRNGVLDAPQTTL